VRTGPIAETRLSHLICPRRLRVEAGFGTWSPVRCSAGRGGCRGFIGPVPLPLSIRLPMNIARRPRCVKRFYAFSIKQILFPLFAGEGCARWSAPSSGLDGRSTDFAVRKSLRRGVVGLHPHHDTGAAANFKRSRLDLDWHRSNRGQDSYLHLEVTSAFGDFLCLRLQKSPRWLCIFSPRIASSMVEQETLNLLVVGSSPTRCT
jgi:hypothetical protein